MKKLQALGYGTLPGPNAFAAKGTGISNTPEECGRELTQMYLSDETQALISCGGGELMCEILDHVDFEAIAAADPKLYMGYSDNTNMTFLLATLCDTAAVYGPCAPAFGMEPWHEALEDALGLLEGKKLEMNGYPAYETESLKDEENPLVRSVGSRRCGRGRGSPQRGHSLPGAPDRRMHGLSGQPDRYLL